MSTESIVDYSLRCPECGHGPLYVRHQEGGPIDSVQGTHYVTTVTWVAECHECQWESPKRSTPWALIRTVQSHVRTSGNSAT